MPEWIGYVFVCIYMVIMAVYIFKRTDKASNEKRIECLEWEIRIHRNKIFPLSEKKEMIRDFKIKGIEELK